MTKKVCTIVGAGPGVALSVAKRFAREGFSIALLARRAEALEGYVADLKQAGAEAIGVPADASDLTALSAALRSVDEKVGPPEVLVYNAAVLRQALPTALDPQGFVDDFKVNVAGALVSAQHAAGHMRAHKRGTILITGGGLALQPYAQYASLSVGKAAVRSLTLSLASELEADGIHVATVTICGFVKPGTHFDPDKIADVYWDLHAQEPGKREPEFIYK